MLFGGAKNDLKKPSKMSLYNNFSYINIFLLLPGYGGLINDSFFITKTIIRNFIRNSVITTFICNDCFRV